MKGKSRQRKTDTPPIPYVKYDTDDIWNMIENGINPQDELDSYDTSAEDILKSQLTKHEMFSYLPTPYSNYAITNRGRVFSFSSSKFIKLYNVSNNLRIYINNKKYIRNVKLETLFSLVDLPYNHEDVLKFNKTFNLIAK